MPPRLAAIPARPFLGLSDEDEKEMIEMISHFVDKEG
jgi:phage gpG-like protein